MRTYRLALAALTLFALSAAPCCALFTSKNIATVLDVACIILHAEDSTAQCAGVSEDPIGAEKIAQAARVQSRHYAATRAAAYAIAVDAATDASCDGGRK